MNTTTSATGKDIRVFPEARNNGSLIFRTNLRRQIGVRWLWPILFGELLGFVDPLWQVQGGLLRQIQVIVAPNMRSRIGPLAAETQGGGFSVFALGSSGWPVKGLPSAIRTMMDFYTQAISADKRKAAFEGVQISYKPALAGKPVPA